jgi:hypothetical protein
MEVLVEGEEEGIHDFMISWAWSCNSWSLLWRRLLRLRKDKYSMA